MQSADGEVAIPASDDPVGAANASIFQAPPREEANDNGGVPDGKVEDEEAGSIPAALASSC